MGGPVAWVAVNIAKRLEDAVLLGFDATHERTGSLASIGGWIVNLDTGFTYDSVASGGL